MAGGGRCIHDYDERYALTRAAVLCELGRRSGCGGAVNRAYCVGTASGCADRADGRLYDSVFGGGRVGGNLDQPNV